MYSFLVFRLLPVILAQFLSSQTEKSPSKQNTSQKPAEHSIKQSLTDSW